MPPPSQKLLVFSDDWGRHPSSCQHLVRAMLPEVSATWVNTIGMRPPRLDWITVKRGVEKIGGWVRPAASKAETASVVPLPEGLSVIDAKMWPWMTHSWDRLLNQKLLARQLSSSSQGATAVTTIPIVADLVGKLPADRWVYYCVDDFSVWPGLDQHTMHEMEQQLIAKVDRVVAVSETLRSKILTVRDQCTLLDHGVDLGHWRSRTAVDWRDRGIEAPVYLFWGVVDRRMDASFLASLNAQMTRGTIVLVGPQQNADPTIHSMRRVRQLGAVSYDDLPGLAAGAAALIMPYIDAPVTRAMQPLKMKEYLATGKPVVARRLPSLAQWADCADLVDDGSAFAQCVLSRAVAGTHAVQSAARRRLDEESWERKAEHFERHLFQW